MRDRFSTHCRFFYVLYLALLDSYSLTSAARSASAFFLDLFICSGVSTSKLMTFGDPMAAIQFSISFPA